MHAIVVLFLYGLPDGFLFVDQFFSTASDFSLSVHFLQFVDSPVNFEEFSFQFLEFSSDFLEFSSDFSSQFLEFSSHFLIIPFNS